MSFEYGMWTGSAHWRLIFHHFVKFTGGHYFYRGVKNHW